MVSLYAFSGSRWMAMHTRANSRRVGHGEIIARDQRNLADDADLAAHMHHERSVMNAQYFNVIKGPQMLDDGFTVFFVAGLQSDFADLVVLGDAFDINGAETAAESSDQRGDSAKASRSIADFEANSKAIACAGSNECTH